MGCNYALYNFAAIAIQISMYKCSKEDPSNVRNEESEKRIVEIYLYTRAITLKN